MITINFWSNLPKTNIAPRSLKIGRTRWFAILGRFSKLCFCSSPKIPGRLLMIFLMYGLGQVATAGLVAIVTRKYYRNIISKTFVVRNSSIWIEKIFTCHCNPQNVLDALKLPGRSSFTTSLTGSRGVVRKRRLCQDWIFHIVFFVHHGNWWWVAIRSMVVVFWKNIPFYMCECNFGWKFQQEIYPRLNLLTKNTIQVH